MTPETTRIVLALVHSSDPDLRAVERALADALEGGGELVLGVVHDPGTEHAISKQLSSRNFVGLKASTNVARLVCQSQQRRESELLERAQVRVAEALGSSARTEMRRGALSEELPKLARELEAARVFLPRMSEGLWDRLLGGRAMDALVKRVQQPVIVVET